MIHSFEDSEILGKFNEIEALQEQAMTSAKATVAELKAAYDHITELKSSLAEMVGIYWGEGDGVEPAPACIQRAQAALAEEIQ